MSIVNKATWAAQHGFQVVDGGLQAPAIPAPPEAQPGPDPVAQLQAVLREAEAEIARQRGLIAQLQTALRSELARRPAPPPAAGARPSPTVRVVRRRRPESPAPPPPEVKKE